jgi:hypothetical protein
MQMMNEVFPVSESKDYISGIIKYYSVDSQGSLIFK